MKKWKIWERFKNSQIHNYLKLKLSRRYLILKTLKRFSKDFLIQRINKSSCNFNQYFKISKNKKCKNYRKFHKMSNKFNDKKENWISEILMKLKANIFLQKQKEEIVYWMLRFEKNSQIIQIWRKKRKHNFKISLN